MNILFIQPNPYVSYNKKFFEKLFTKLNFSFPSLAFPSLAATTQKKHKITMIDEKNQSIDFNKKYDLVGITAMTNEIKRAFEIADTFRKKKIPVVIGGCHATALPDESKSHADSVVIGEADDLWPQLLNDLEKGKLEPYYKQEKPVDLKKIPIPYRKILPKSHIINGIQTTRGCPHKCKFCYVGSSAHGRIFRKRSIEDIVEELKNIPQKLIYFYDSSLTIDLEHTKKLCLALKKVNKKYIFLGNINVLSKNEEILKLSREAGCIQWSIGFESISQNSLDEVSKKTNKVEEYIDAVKKIHDHKMLVHGFFMFGFDHDPKTIFKDTMDFIRQTGIDSVNFSILTPFPGTPLFEELDKEGRINTKDWTKYFYSKDPVFTPNNFTKEELISNLITLYKEYYSLYEIKNRFFKTIKRGLFNFHPLLFILENIFVRYRVLEIIEGFSK